MAGKHFKSSTSAGQDIPRDDFDASDDGEFRASHFTSDRDDQTPGPSASGAWPDQEFSTGAMPIGTISDDRLVRVRRKRRRRGPLIAGIVAGVLVAVVLVCCGLFAWSAWGVANDAKEVLAEVSELKESLSGTGSSSMEESAEVIAEKADDMAAEVDGLLWKVAAHLPLVGGDIANIRALVGILDDLSDDAITPLAAQASNLDLSELISDGAINVEAIEQLAAVVVEVAPAFETATEELDALEEGRIDYLNEAIDEVDDTLSTLSSLCSGLAELEPYLGDLLGANGTRTYLILAHNTSELKSSGGFIGSVGTLTITDGVFDLGDFSSFSFAIRDYEDKDDTSDRAYVTEEEDALFSWTYGLLPGNSGANPDFSREGEMACEMYESAAGVDDIAGVIALDTTVLARMLSLVGSVTLDDGTEVSGDNCVQLIGYDIYWEYFSDDAYDSTSNDEADALFAAIAGAAFDGVVDNIGSVGLLDLMETLASCFEDDRLSIWMEDDDEQAAMESLDLAGTVSHDETAPELGVYLEASGGSKLSWWAACDTTWTLVSQDVDGTRTYSVTTTIANTITQEEVDQASIYIKGRYEGAAYYNVYLFAPAGGTISDVEVSTGAEAGYYTLDGIEVGKVHLSVAPESEVTITYTVTTSADAEQDMTLRTTPLAQTDGE